MEYDLHEHFPLPLRGRGMLAASEPGEGALPEATYNSEANEGDLPASAPPSLEHFRTIATSSPSAGRAPGMRDCAPYSAFQTRIHPRIGPACAPATW